MELNGIGAKDVMHRVETFGEPSLEGYVYIEPNLRATA
jgi:hypothetical protein